MLSSNEEEYKKTSEYFKQWNSKYFAFKFDEKKETVWTIGDDWVNFKVNNLNGLLALMVLGEYDESLKYSDKVLEYEDTLLETRINKGAQGGLLTVAKVVAAKAGAGGNWTVTSLSAYIRSIVQRNLTSYLSLSLTIPHVITISRYLLTKSKPHLPTFPIPVLLPMSG